MTRTDLTMDDGFHERLRLAIDETGMTHQEFAETYGLKARSVSRYVTGTQAPDGPAMQRLAKALGGRFAWVLTGEQPTALQQRTVGSLPPALQELVAVSLTLADELQRALVSCAKLFARGLKSPAANIVLEAILAWTKYLQRGREIGPDDPLFPPPHSSS